MPAVENPLPLHRIAGHHEVGQQAQGVRDGLHLLVLHGWIAGHATGVDRTLQGADGLAAFEHTQQFPAKGFIDEVVGQKDGALQSPKLHERLVQRIAARS